MQRIGIVIFPGFQLMGLAMSSVFEYANVAADENRYDIHVLSEHGGAVPG